MPSASRSRAAALYSLDPHDKSAWARLRDPRYWLLQLPSYVPVYGIPQIWWLVQLVLRDRRDEYQLVNFIIGMFNPPQPTYLVADPPGADEYFVKHGFAVSCGPPPPAPVIKKKKKTTVPDDASLTA